MEIVQVKIRGARLSEAGRIYRELFAPLKQVAFSRQIVEAVIKEKHAISLIAKYNSELVGCIIARSEGAKNYWLYGIVVHAAWQGRGIGTQLLGALIEEAKRRGAARLATDAPDFPKAPLLRFLKKRGFRIVGRLPGWYERADQLILFKKL